MENFGSRIKKYWITYLITMAISLAVGAGIFCLVYFLGNQTDIALCNGLTLGGAIILGIGGLTWITRQGFFDFVVYGFKQLGSSMFNRHAPAKYDDLPTYKQEKNQKRISSPDYWFPIVIAGTLILIAGIIATIVFNSKY